MNREEIMQKLKTYEEHEIFIENTILLNKISIQKIIFKSI